MSNKQLFTALNLALHALLRPYVSGRNAHIDFPKATYSPGKKILLGAIDGRLRRLR